MLVISFYRANQLQVPSHCHIPLVRCRQFHDRLLTVNNEQALRVTPADQAVGVIFIYLVSLWPVGIWGGEAARQETCCVTGMKTVVNLLLYYSYNHD